MGNSLREELLKAGLVTEEGAEPERPRRGKRKRRRRRDAPPAEMPARASTRDDGMRSRAVARDPLINRNSAKAQRRKRRQEVLDLAESRKQNLADGERAYNFVRGKRVKRVHVSEEQHAALVAGELAIVGLDGEHYLVSPEVAEQIHALANDAFVHRGGDQGSAGDDSDESSHPVPDDLAW